MSHWLVIFGLVLLHSLMSVTHEINKKINDYSISGDKRNQEMAKLFVIEIGYKCDVMIQAAKNCH